MVHVVSSTPVVTTEPEVTDFNYDNSTSSSVTVGEASLEVEGEQDNEGDDPTPTESFASELCAYVTRLRVNPVPVATARVGGKKDFNSYSLAHTVLSMTVSVLPSFVCVFLTLVFTNFL